MYEMTKRQKELIKLLLDNNAFLPVRYYANLLKVSERTVHSDLKKIERLLRDTKSFIEKKPRHGIRLENGGNLDKLLSGFDQNQENNSPFYRQILIARDLLVRGKTISYQLLSEKFLVSKTSISNNIDQIQFAIRKCKVEIVSNHKGTKIVGKESDLQQAIKDYAYHIIQTMEQSSEFKIQFPKELNAFLPPKIIDRILVLLQQYLQVNVADLSDNVFQSLVLSLGIFFTRLEHGEHIEEQNYLLFENIESLQTHFFTTELLERLKLQGELKISQNDFTYLNKQLIAHGLEPKLEEALIQKYGDIVHQIIEEMGKTLNLKFLEDNKLYQNVLYHLFSMIYRLQMNVLVNNPLLEEIKEQYSVLFSTTWLVFSKFENILGIKLTEDEVAFMTIHFQAAIDRLAGSHRIIIVCPTGIGTAELIANRLQKIVAPHDILQVISLRTLYQSDLSKIDLIISSIDLEEMNVPVVYVSPLMSREDLKKVSAKYLDLFYTEQVDTVDIKFEHLHDVIDQKLIFLDEEYTSKAECIGKLAGELLKQGVVSAGFEQAIWEREKLGVTDLASGVAIPHAPPAMVKKSTLAIMTLKTPIRWQTRTIDTLIVICISKEDFSKVKGILSEVYKIVESRQTVQQIFFSKTKKQIIEKLGGTKSD
ncbi:BglG family transcription antiterminator [Enterococcus olivae]